MCLPDTESYLPPGVRGTKPDEIDFADRRGVPAGLTVVRRLPLEDYRIDEPSLKVSLLVQGRARPIGVSAGLVMRFGTETVTAADYANRVLEPGDWVDFVYDPTFPAGDRIRCFWIHIEYLENCSPDARFSRKDDGLFAMRAKSGEKAQRVAARDLVQRFGHVYSDTALRGTRTFQIRYSEKKQRRPDLICPRCGLKVEVKKRNRDRKYRVSHSELRPLESEHRPQDWHALVFPDGSVHYLANEDIIEDIMAGYAILGADEYDSWADISDRVGEKEPPACSTAGTV
jgi:hypothetical protein